jgi:hypothetical protein
MVTYDKDVYWQIGYIPITAIILQFKRYKRNQNRDLFFDNIIEQSIDRAYYYYGKIIPIFFFRLYYLLN